MQSRSKAVRAVTLLRETSQTQRLLRGLHRRGEGLYGESRLFKTQKFI